ncbi:hypothetical protein HOY82DRAFT_602992 [Tuber indicum]|nr:hypothetical protein HOY82DRAFT_602992 [Tuber indicum]
MSNEGGDCGFTLTKNGMESEDTQRRNRGHRKRGTSGASKTRAAMTSLTTATGLLTSPSSPLGLECNHKVWRLSIDIFRLPGHLEALPGHPPVLTRVAPTLDPAVAWAPPGFGGR